MFALGYFGFDGLPAALVEIAIEQVERGVELCRERYAGGQPVALLGHSKGAELALQLASQLGGAISRTVAIAPQQQSTDGQLRWSTPCERDFPYLSHVQHRPRDLCAGWW